MIKIKGDVIFKCYTRFLFLYYVINHLFYSIILNNFGYFRSTFLFFLHVAVRGAAVKIYQNLFRRISALNKSPSILSSRDPS